MASLALLRTTQNFLTQASDLNQLSPSTFISSLPPCPFLEGRAIASFRRSNNAQRKYWVPKGFSEARALAVDRTKLHIVNAGTVHHSQHGTLVPEKEQKEPSTGQGRQPARVLDSIATLANGVKEKIITAVVDSLFKPAGNVNIFFAGNFAPVPEISGRVAAKIIEGSIPADFPEGVYLRNGPNPQFGTDDWSSHFGKIHMHWFEGDGMVHATYFGPEGKVEYQNKFIETKGYKMERERKRRLWLGILEGDSKATVTACLFNLLRFGTLSKETCNTTVFEHGGRVFVGAEGDLPREFNPWDLSTGGQWDWNGQWKRRVCAHPKVDPATKEMIISGYSFFRRPYYKIGVVSADGERIVHTCDIELEKCKIMHDIGVTKRYNIILDWPLVIDPNHIYQGVNLIAFDGNAIARVGIIPRFGNTKMIKWFDVDTNYTFHVINAYDDGDEVVLHGCRARMPMFPSKQGMDKIAWYSRGITLTHPKGAKDPCVYGVLFSHAHEWRFNLKTGTIVEQDLTNDNFAMEMPKINDCFIGLKNKYAYADVLDIEQSKAAGMPKFGRLVKLHLIKMDTRNHVKVEFYHPGPHVYLSEPLFVPRSNGNEEDDGWIITYAHNEKSNISEEACKRRWRRLLVNGDLAAHVTATHYQWRLGG